MCTVTAAAGWQARVVAGVKSRCERPQPEEQDEEDGKRAPHLVFMLHESSMAGADGEIRAALRYHRFIACHRPPY